ncbi:hypothetical protein [Nocardia sp. NPDC020380]|uniref:hypothetical protein n=1 Tax=Nocardia sp. NPDC020380 TaxID=3364309 RepID=UPI0037A8D60F
MKRTIFGRIVAAVAVSMLISAPLAVTASAAVVPMHQQPPGSAGGPPPDGRDWRDGGPGDRDRHCDRNGYWHDNDNDGPGHRDNRCDAW